VRKDFRRYYYFLGTLGRKLNLIGGRLLHEIVERIPIGDRVLLAIDDTPTKRFGPWVEGADVHRNPTPGPAEQTFLYGHVWVTLSLLCYHPWWGTIGLPLLARLYVRRKNMSFGDCSKNRCVGAKRRFTRFAGSGSLRARSAGGRSSACGT
jgi:hypothetical protein